MRKILAGAITTLAISLSSLTSAYAAGTKADVDRYLDEVATALDRPGVYVDPAVVAEGELTEAETSRLTRATRGRPGPLRIAVLPVDRLQVDRGGVGSASLAYRPLALVAKLFKRVGDQGTYAVLVSAPSRAEGRSFYAVQWPPPGTRDFDVKGAVDTSLDCCAPDYFKILKRFVKESDEPLRRGGGDPPPMVEEPIFVDDEAGGFGVGGIGGTGLLGLGILGVVAVGIFTAVRRFSARPRPATPDPEALPTLRATLSEEVEEVRQRIGALGPAVGDRAAEIDAHVEAARQRLDDAHTALTSMTTPDGARPVIVALADTRYELAAATALADGRPVPERTPPCFVDPRHGLSVAQTPYPQSGTTAPVPVCSGCQSVLGAGREPSPRMVHHRGSWLHHWSALGPASYYLGGYWPGHAHLHHHDSHVPAEAGSDDWYGADRPASFGGSGFDGHHGGGHHGGGGGGHHGGGGGGHGGGGGGGHGGGRGF